MKKIISLDIGGTLYGHNSITNCWGKLNPDPKFPLSMTGLSMLQIVKLMRHECYILLNSDMEDGKMMQKILADITYFCSKPLNFAVNHDKNELIRLFESNFFVSSYCGRKIVQIKYCDASFAQKILIENTIDCKNTQKLVQCFDKIEPEINIRSIFFRHGDHSEKLAIYTDCETSVAHTAQIELENASPQNTQKLASYLNYAGHGQLQAIADEKSVFVGQPSSKEFALTRLCAILNIDKSSAIHMGDSPADILDSIDSVMVSSKNCQSAAKQNTLEAELMRLC